MIDGTLARTIFVATLPILLAILGLLGTVVWNLIEVKEIRKELVSIRERLATLEERDRWIHPVARS